MGVINVIQEGEIITGYRGNWEFTLDGGQCIGCGQCVPECPTGALFAQPWSIGVGDSFFESAYLAFQSTKCEVGECGEPCQTACGVEAITARYVPPFEPPPPTFCDLFPEVCEEIEAGEELFEWINNQCDILTPKNANTLLQSKAVE